MEVKLITEQYENKLLSGEYEHKRSLAALERELTETINNY